MNHTFRIFQLILLILTVKSQEKNRYYFLTVKKQNFIWNSFNRNYTVRKCKITVKPVNYSKNHEKARSG